MNLNKVFDKVNESNGEEEGIALMELGKAANRLRRLAKNTEDEGLKGELETVIGQIETALYVLH